MRPLLHDARFDLVALGEPLLEFNQTRAGEELYLQGFGGDTSRLHRGRLQRGDARERTTLWRTVRQGGLGDP